MNDRIDIQLRTGNGNFINIAIFADTPGTLQIIDEQQAAENGESPYQLSEGAIYEYRLTEGYELRKSEIVRPSHIDPSRGRLITNIHVGSLEIEILTAGKPVATFTLEVTSVKTGYRTDYRKMLEDITEHCIDLLLQQSSVVSQTFTVDAPQPANPLSAFFVCRLHHPFRTLR